MDPLHENLRCVALAGGVGGARMADGLYRALAPDMLTVIVNTGDDFEHHGLTVCPDLDTVMYTLARMVSHGTGWGIAGDTHHAMEQLGLYGEEQWFTIGDRDLATHVHRTAMMRAGHSLTDVTRALTDALGIHAALLPMADRPVPTFVITRHGERLAFQDYYVRRQHRDEVAKLEFANVRSAKITAPARQAIDEAEVIVFCPSNPFLSIAPILEVQTMRLRIQGSRAVRIGVSPIVAGEALRGPAADIMRSLGHESSALGIGRLYRGLVHVLFIDEQDAALAPAIRDLGLEVVAGPTVMRTSDDRQALARRILATARERLATATS